MKQVQVTIHDEFVGDVDIDCDVLDIDPANVMYDENDLATKLEMEEVPEHVDEDVRIRAIEELIYGEEDWDKYEDERKAWEEVVV